MRALLLSVLAAAACGGAAKKPTGPTFAKGAKVRISDGGQIYDALNTTACVAWPSPEIKHRAGRDGWNGWDPDTGIEGEVIAALTHCDHRTQVVLIEVAGYVVPVTSAGVEAVTPEVAVEGGGVGGDVYGDVYGGDVYGGDVYGNMYGEEYGGEYDWDNAPAGGSYVAGDLVRIVSTGGVYSTINTYDCLTWPSDDAKQRGGEDAWSGWTPTDGDLVTVLGSSFNCNDASEEVLIVDDGGYVVPISIWSIEPSY